MLKLEDDGRWYLDGQVLLVGDKVEAYFPAVQEWHAGEITFSDIGYPGYFFTIPHRMPGDELDVTGTNVPMRNIEQMRRPLRLDAQ